LCIIAQGAKTVIVGQEVYEYDPSRMLVFAVQLPVLTQVVRATSSEPYLGLVLDLDPRKLGELAHRVCPNGLRRSQSSRGLYVGAVPDGLADAAVRLVTLLADPDEAAVLGPLVVDEILIRLLRSEVGPRVAQIGRRDSRVQLVAKAIAWLRDNYSQPVTVEALAKLVHMSESSFHQHFKAVTSLSPLQYQKTLRLLEARRLLMSETEDAGGTAHRVGYLSASQFSREYARYFGNAPIRDIDQLRERGYTAADMR
jgi:AraC-like DNA-binding protein